MLVIIMILLLTTLQQALSLLHQAPPSLSIYCLSLSLSISVCHGVPCCAVLCYAILYCEVIMLFCI